MTCYSCKPVMAFKDLKGNLFEVESQCIKSNKAIKLMERLDECELKYRELWPDFFPSNIPTSYAPKGYEVLWHFLSTIGKDGYTITKLEEVE